MTRKGTRALLTRHPLSRSSKTFEAWKKGFGLGSLFPEK